MTDVHDIDIQTVENNKLALLVRFVWSFSTGVLYCSTKQYFIIVLSNCQIGARYD